MVGGAVHATVGVGLLMLAGLLHGFRAECHFLSPSFNSSLPPPSLILLLLDPLKAKQSQARDLHNPL